MCAAPTRSGERAADRRPLKAYVEPTTACNLACTTCARHAWDEPEGWMAWETFEAVVDGLESGTVAFMGLGEPLLHPLGARDHPLPLDGRT